MRISDWSSDVCSSDLKVTARRRHRIAHAARQGLAHALRQRLDALQPQPALRRVADRRSRRAAGHEALAAGRARNRPRSDPALLRIRRGDVAQRRAASPPVPRPRSEEHTSELQSLMRIPYAVLCLEQNNLKPTTE